MMDATAARQIVATHLATIRVAPGDDILIFDEYTREKPYGWIFFHGSRINHETKNPWYALIGNGPIIVDKITGKLTFLGTADAVDVTIREYEIRKNLPSE